jgi:hypothetical protein
VCSDTPRAEVLDNGALNNNNKKKKKKKHTGTARYQGTAENSYIGHSTHTAGSANVEAQRSLILQTALCAPLTVRTG